MLDEPDDLSDTQEMSSAEQWDFVARVAAELGAKPEAIRKWRARGKVPHKWRLPILGVADAAHVKLDRRVFDNVPQVAA